MQTCAGRKTSTRPSSRESARFGHIDIVLANAGVASSGRAWELTEEQWAATLDVNLSGVWRTCNAALPQMIEAGRGGCILITSSTGAVRGFPNLSHYSASKHGTLGLMRSLAAEVAQHGIRVNAVLPTVVETAMSKSADALRGLYPDLDDPTPQQIAAAYRPTTQLPIDWLAPIDVANAVLWLCSDEARNVTAIALPVDAGALEKVA